MRIWDISPKNLCRQHLLGEHRELHAIWTVLIENKKGYSKHPETLRWKGKLKALYLRHEKLVKEMKRRGYNHLSPLDKRYARGKNIQNVYIDKPSKQKELLNNKDCDCKL
ncbi:MAG: pyrimidine dimer DNA glycosylase/endonuclease V [Candidatus Komeilibacteria bacterium]